MKYGLGLRYACLGSLEVADFGGLNIFSIRVIIIWRDNNSAY